MVRSVMLQQLMCLSTGVAGCMYRVLQTTGPDGKNLLKLLPISKSSGSFVPIVQSSAMQNNSSPVHLTFKTQLADPTTPPSVKIPVFQSANPGKILLTRTLDKQESGRAGSEKESLAPKPAAAIQSTSVSVDRLSVQNMAVTSSSSQSNAAYMLVNNQTLPVSVKAPVLPSGHHLQIPADAEVKSVLASSLPPAIQQKILAAAATNAPGGADGAKPPTVIYVSPVNTVRTVLPKRLQPICPKPAPEPAKTFLVTAPQKGNGSSPEAVPADGQQCRQTPMKWIVQESPQSSAPCLIPVKSSNNVASRILKTLSDTKNVEINSANILPLSSSGPGGSQKKMTPFKDNALVMYNGKVYLLTKRDSDVLSAQVDKQGSSSSDASLKKETSKLIDSTAVNKITNKVVNLVLSKTKGVALSQKDPNSKRSSPVGLRNDLKSAPAALGTPSAQQQNSTVDHRRSLPFTQSTLSGVTLLTAAGTQEKACQNGKEKIHSPKAPSAVLPQSKQEGAFSEDWQKIQCETMNSPGKVQIRQEEKPHWKQYLELRKKFGLSKEERVYLRRIPSKASVEKAEERVCSSNSLKRKNDSYSSPLDVEIPNQHQECIKEEKMIVGLEEDLTKKRRVKSSSQSHSGKRRRTSVQSTPSPSSEDSSSSCSVASRSVSPPPALSPQHNIPTDCAASPLGQASEQDPYSQSSDLTDSDIPVLVSSEDNSSFLEGSFRDDTFPLTPPDLDETIRDEKIKRLKQLLREREAALEEMRRRMQQS
ncbi:ligand-dependent nuclear receptor-interacting factor 1 isoform X2 [Colius striatus]|uniref:ligand-dependent nuclear receptor-interacting factor 1 isoform X2 n=1 Tax=Colius striatus TaxID=57412 RepID=UPI002B1DB6D6|nr:ligand-dependent nuclear receptor-interacting factor 1 isoform X2 [Colius striatus]XP_061869324.1 ligand-dependent nuclear receptor-interacting factor 1 isoform X2 [Colius striatus]XP_061869325.1 ligand-dependent nuclear receptor-interacting factor 1 isoform X2 [Colius striatus]